jgi:uroporphyrinogen decarboxylase
MVRWLADMRAAKVKKALPILSFPCVQLMNISVKDLISSSDNQARGMKLVADRCPAAAAVSLMDLSVEAECFGSTIRFSDFEVPTVIGGIVSDKEGAEALKVPQIGAGRTGIYIEAIEKAAQSIADRPTLAGVIGPFSLAGRLCDVSQAMIYCYDEPDMIHTLMGKATDFLIDYIEAFNQAGANGVLIAEPLTGLLSPDLAKEFSEPYVRKIARAVKDESFIAVYHNCGGATIKMIDSILATEASAFHFGNAISMAEMMPRIPADVIAMGNVEPAGRFRNGTPESVKAETKRIMSECREYPNFVISSGCDIPPMSPWENIDAFFAAVNEFYEG